MSKQAARHRRVPVTRSEWRALTNARELQSEYGWQGSIAEHFASLPRFDAWDTDAQTVGYA